MSKAKKSTTGWRRRYLVNPDGLVWLVRGRGKLHNGDILYQVHVNGRWTWLSPDAGVVVDTEAQLVVLRLQGVPVRGEPRW